ncbi:MAG: deoxynucleoside kinase [Bacteroidota bacterium]
MSSPAIPDDLRYVAIEGVIGAGKTSLTRRLSERYNGSTVLEAFDENPFLADFYDEPDRWAFHTQLSFLASRFKQKRALFDRDLFRQVVFSDYTFDKDKIFAHLTLTGDERTLYDTLFNLVEPTIPVPDLVVYLRSSTDRLMANIAKRGRSYELEMKRSYIESLGEAYDYYFDRYDKCPLLIVDSTRIDFVNNPEHLEALVHQIIGVQHAGTRYFAPDAAPDMFGELL